VLGTVDKSKKWLFPHSGFPLISAEQKKEKPLLAGYRALLFPYNTNGLKVYCQIYMQKLKGMQKQ